MFEPSSQIWQWPRRLVVWLCGGREGYREFLERKQRKAYRARRGLCLWLWLGAAALMLICPGGSCLVPLFLAATFLSFAILDEH